MSRHKIVRTMNLADELDDFDGEDDYYGEEDEGMSPADKARMADGLKRVREVIGSDVPSLTDEKIEETLWYYYFDVERSITYLLNQVGATEKKKQKKPVVPEPKVREHFMTLSLPLLKNIRPGFWDDTPFGGVPLARQGRLLPPPPLVGFRTSGLLGGMQSGKVSKLAALAKARNKAKAEKAADSASPTTSGTAVSLLDRLSKKKPDPPPITHDAPVSTISIIPNISKLEQLVEKAIPDPPKNEPVQNEPSIPGPEPDVLLKASPSGFAKSMFGERIGGPFEFKEEFTDAQLIYFSIAPTQKAAIKAKQAFDVPSPDDVVIAAQSQSKGISKSSKGEKAGSNTTASIQKGVEALKVGDTSEKPALPKIPRNKIDVLAEYEKSKSKRKENANLVVIGHVDAGKSTLMGRLLYDSGVVDERTIQKYKQEAEKIGKSSFALAWVLDQTGEERARGVTIDIAVNAFETERGRFTILDAPGHRDFIPNMIAGAAQADFAVLVIDSSPGEFEAGFNVRGQTKEHALLVRSMGVQRIIVAVNKLDLMHWDQDRFDEIKQQMSQFLTTAGFQPKNVSFIPCSGLTGDNIVRKPADGLIPWYSGPTLVEELETAKPVIKAIEKPLRMTIADVYRGGVINPVTISGRIEVGNVQVGDTIVAIPGDEKAIVKGIEVDNQTAEWAVAGNNVQLHLANIEIEYLKIGDVICQADNPLVPLKEFEAKILAFEGLTPMMIDIHRGRLNASGRITKLVATLDKGNGSVTKKKPRHIGPGSLAVVNIAVTGAPLPLEKGSKIVLRADGLTVAAGVVE
ncbi:Hsp70 suppressor, GTPase facilitates ribosomal subunit dissociation, variant 2 [Orbilia oligospora]|nr:Hsp70 suppressor, GTPase facilitates ribosomal subunit dissociation, variant 2 [Orbilia oligospora]KAF3267137.1 Hsp70 suppressor, GTPase facilitates ribosomal subunit dissociation, variant 2 [Orbilia oligospora]